MKKFKLVSRNEKIFLKLIEGFNCGEENFDLLKKCTVNYVIVTPENKSWRIYLSTPQNLGSELLQGVESFIGEKFSLTATISEVVRIERKFTPPPPKKSVEKTSVTLDPVGASKSVNKKTSSPRSNVSAEKKSTVEVESGEKIYGKKITGGVMNISDITLDSKVIICGEIGDDDKNGVNFRDFKTGSSAITFSLTDKTNGIVCKKFFKQNAHDAAEKIFSQLKNGMSVKISGAVKYDDYLKENVVMIDAIEKFETHTAERQDNAEIKRVELHAHTTMSTMDAVVSAKKLVTQAANWNWSAIAITDHGVVQAFPEAAQTAEKLKKQGKNIKIIYGMEGYLNVEDDQKSGYHIILLAKNKVGLNNLYRLISISQIKYFHRTPRIPKKLLAQCREGLIIGSACEAGELIRGIVAGKTETEIEEIANFYDYLEIQPYLNNEFLIRSKDFPNINTEDDLIDINKKVAALAEKLNKPLVATCDSHFLNKEDYIYRAILMNGKGFEDADRQPPLYLRTTEEMLAEFKYLDEKVAYDAVVTNPNKIAEQIEVLKPIPDGLYSPTIPGADEEIREMSYKKAKYLYGENLPEIVSARLEQELKPIITHGFSSLYLIAQRLVKKSNDDGYLVGSRGSVGSSFVATMTGITEVNPLPPHYRCPKCQYSHFFTHGEVGCGYDLENKNCPVCGYPLIKDGHDIPFAVFLGFDGDKVPDIDLNFSGEYQPVAHKYTEVLFGRHNVYRAGSIMTVAEKTAFGFVKKYLEEKKITKHGSFIAKMAKGCMGVKSTTGQHPAGIMVVPRDMDIHYFSPIQYPAEKKSSETITTHFDYHSISSRLVKLDILGHDDPTVIKMLENLTHRDPKTIPLDDKPTLSLFSSTNVLGLTPQQLKCNSGTFGIPEFRTPFTRQMIDDTHPDCFSDLVRISGFSHGTDVWLGNAQDLIKDKTCTLKNAISARDDIMMYLIHHGVDALKSFKIMENVRKGKGISPDAVEDLKAHNVPDWYIDSCQKIKYLFPRAHATAYVMMAYRIAYCKVHYPLAYYAAYFSIRADEFDANEITKGLRHIKAEMEKLNDLADERKLDNKEADTLAVLQLAYEMYLRGFSVEKVDLYKSDAEKFIVLKKSLLPPLASLVGVGQVAAKGIAEARKTGKFSSIEDLRTRSGINKTAIAALQEHGCLQGMDESDQVSLFNFGF